MTLSSSLVSQFVKATSDDTPKKVEATVYGKIVKDGDTKYVRIDGSEILTPVESETAIEDGDRVSVKIKDHTAVVTGNLTSPSTNDERVASQISEFEVIVADKVSTKDFDAEKGRIDDLVSKNVTITGQLNANSASISSLSADNVAIHGTLNANSANITDLQTSTLKATDAELKYASIENLNATDATVRNLQADYGKFNKLTTDDLSAIHATIGTLDVTFATVDLANIKDGAIKTAMIDNSAIGSAQIADGSITDAKIVGLTANKITAGKLDAAEIEVVNLDAANITVGTINGQQIAPGAIDFDKLGTSLGTTITNASSNASNAITTANDTKAHSIFSVDVMYALGNSEATEPTTGWSTTAPPWESGKYMWQKIVTTYGDKTQEESESTCITGAIGQNGNDGAQGPKGDTGATGNGVKTIQEQYYLSTSNTTQTGGSWQTAQPTWANGEYIWTRSHITWSDNTTTDTTPILADAINKANTTATNASSTASAAATNASTALTTANSASSKADSALSTANAANTAAATAQTTANGKNTVYYSTAAPSGGTYKTNDIWFDTDDGNRMYSWSGSAWITKQFGANAIADLAITNAKITDGTIQNGKIANLDAGKITTGTLSADRIGANTITAAKIATGTITAAKIAAGTITATQIAGTTITGDKIVASTITGDKISAKTITANNMVANTITAASGIIADAAITNAKIANATIESAKIKSIDAAKITSGYIDAARINTGTITIGKLDTSTQTIISTASSNASSAVTTASSALSTANTAKLLTEVETISSNMKKFKNVCGYTYDRGDITGMLLIITPITPDRMVQLHIKGYNYNTTKETIDLEIGFYNYQSKFASTGFINKGSFPITSVSVAKVSTSDTRAVIYIGTASTVWSYPKIIVDEVITGYSTVSPDSYKDGFSATITTTKSYTTHASTISGKDTFALSVGADAAIAAWCYANNRTYINGGKIYTGTITATQIAANAITADKIVANAITSAKIATDALKSRNYVANSTGMFLNLANGSIDSKNFKVSAAGEVNINGSLTSDNSVTPYKVELDDGYIRVYGSDGKDSFHVGNISSIGNKSTGIFKGMSFSLSNSADEMTFGIRNADGSKVPSYYCINNGANPNGYTNRHIWWGNEAHCGTAQFLNGIEIKTGRDSNNKLYRGLTTENPIFIEVGGTTSNWSSETAFWTNGSVTCKGAYTCLSRTSVTPNANYYGTAAMLYVDGGGNECAIYSKGYVSTDSGTCVVSPGKDIHKLRSGNGYMEITQWSGATYGINWWSSDSKLKKDIKQTEINAVKVIKMLRHYQYNWKDVNNKEHVKIGYMAHELKLIDNNLAFEVKQDIKSPYNSLLQIDHTKLIPYLSKAIQEIAILDDERDKKLQIMQKQIYDLQFKVQQLQGGN